ncbi:MAG: GTPase Era [Oscillospiraceae bacterium]|nr:GTPase Era [Oscillospiraceae bacterium]
MATKITKNCTAAIIGRPNAGKSTLINTLVGEKIAIVTPKPQTTRTTILGVVNTDDTQFVFTDTPGYHKPRTKLGGNMVQAVGSAISGTDCCVLVVPPEPNVGRQEQALLARVAAGKIPCILAINKVDTIAKEEIFAIIGEYMRYAEEIGFTFVTIVPISAKRADGTAELLDEVAHFAQDGGELFTDGVITNQTDTQIICEIIREKLLFALEREIPHGIAVELERFSERDAASGEPVIDIDAVIYCEKQSHKGIVIGKNGEVLRKIGQYAREDIEKYMGTKVSLHTFVKVRENWRDSPGWIKNLGLNAE